MPETDEDNNSNAEKVATDNDAGDMTIDPPPNKLDNEDVDMKTDQIKLTVDTAAANAAANDDDMEIDNNNTVSTPKGTMTPTPKSYDTATNNKKEQKRQSISGAAWGGATTPATQDKKSMDSHPYARGSVIEVLYIPATQSKKETEEWYWSDDSSLCSSSSSSVEGEPEKVEDGNGGEEKDKSTAAPDHATSNNQPHKTHRHHHRHHAASIKLCDIIDRVPIPKANDPAVVQQPALAPQQLQQQQWRYYVHYRDFNRRMDEWVGQDRIVSPPSIGNAKARALKKEEEKQKRKLARLEEKQRAEQQKQQHRTLVDLDVTAPRSSRRRSSVQQNQSFLPASSPTAVAAAPASMVVAGEPGADEGDGRRKTRWKRRKSTAMDDDAATVVASNQEVSGDDGGAGSDGANEKVPAAVKGIVALPTASPSAMETMTVGEHVVATIPAQELDEHEGLDEASLREHEEITKIKNVSFIEIGRHQMETWYFSPIPKELLSQKGYIEILYICEFSFRLFARKCELQRFQRRSLPPEKRHPPGNEIYRKGNLSMFEVDGLTEKIYCQNLCFIAKLFLDHKTLYFDVDPFLFYVLCEVDDRGYHPVGYYSKEKYSDVGYNLSCILTFPAHQRKGYGRFLISFSYELSKKQEKVGGPERPVSDLGQKAYKPYWAATVIDFLRQTGTPNPTDENADGNKNDNKTLSASSFSIMDISKKTSIMAEDIVFTLNQLGLLKMINGVYFIAAEDSLLEKLAKKYPVKEPRVDPTKLHWTPFLTDVKRDKFSIHSKKPSVESTAIVQGQKPGQSQQQQPTQQKVTQQQSPAPQTSAA